MKRLALFLPMFALALPAAAGPPSIDSLMYLIVYLVVVGLIFWCIWYFIGYVGVPQPFDKVIRVLLGLIALIIVVSLLLGILGHPFSLR